MTSTPQREGEGDEDKIRAQLVEIYARIHANIRPLSLDCSRILYENLWDLYDEAPTTPQGKESQ